jgi:hypothetical protein
MIVRRLRATTVRGCSYCGTKIPPDELLVFQLGAGLHEHFSCWMERHAGYAVMEGRASWWPLAFDVEPVLYDCGFIVPQVVPDQPDADLVLPARQCLVRQDPQCLSLVAVHRDL